MASSDDESSLSSSEEESQDNDSQEENEIDVWDRLQQEVIDRHEAHWKELVEHYHQLGNSQEVAETKATNDLVPTYRNELRQVLFDTVKWMHDFRKDPYFKKITETRKNLMDNDGFDWIEATEAAIEKRKFLLNSLFKKQPIPDQPEVPKWGGGYYRRL